MKPRVVAIAISLLLTPALAYAEPAKDGSDPAAAQTLFYEARNLMKAGKFADACPKLEESLRLDDGIGTRFNLADCDEHVGKVASAWAQFLEVAARAKTTKQPDREKVARQRAAALEPRLPKLIVQVENKSDGIEVTRDGIAIGSAAWGSPIPIDPGRHALRATAPGKQAWETTIEAPEGKTVEINVPKTLPPAGAVAAPAVITQPPPQVVPPPGGAPIDPSNQTQTTGAAFPDAVREDHGSAQKTVGFILGGAGLASLGVAGGFGILSMTKRHSAESHCDGSSCDATGVKLKNDALTSGNVATYTAIGGGAALLGGILLVLTSPSSSSEPPHGAAMIRAVPSVAVGGGGLMFEGSLQ